MCLQLLLELLLLELLLLELLLLEPPQPAALWWVRFFFVRSRTLTLRFLFFGLPRRF